MTGLDQDQRSRDPADLRDGTSPLRQRRSHWSFARTRTTLYGELLRDGFRNEACFFARFFLPLPSPRKFVGVITLDDARDIALQSAPS